MATTVGANQLPPQGRYGAPELKVAINKNTIRGSATALALLALLITGHFIMKTIDEYDGGALQAGMVKTKIDLSKLPPPPSNSAEPPPPPPPAAEKVVVASGPASRAGTPVPVPDALIPPDVKDFASVTEVSRASVEGGSGEDFGGWEDTDGAGLDLGNVTFTEESEEPDADEFIAVEKEPYVELGDLQRLVKYPDLAKRTGVEGKVVLRVLVGKNGKPKKTLVESTDNSILDKAATEAVMKAVFTPGIQNGQAVDCWVSVPIVFKLR